MMVQQPDMMMMQPGMQVGYEEYPPEHPHHKKHHHHQNYNQGF